MKIKKEEQKNKDLSEELVKQIEEGEVMRKTYKLICKECGVSITGTSPKHVLSNFNSHCLIKHILKRKKKQ